MKEVWELQGDRMATSFRPPNDLWEVNRRLQIDQHLDGDKDPRWVDTEIARGDYSLSRLCRTLGVDRDKRRLSAPDQGYFLFYGHRGCGKSTELRRIKDVLHHEDLYYVVFADAAQQLDVNNLRYQDVLLHLASELVGKLQEDNIEVENAYISKLQDWFTERVEKKETTRAFALEAKVGVGANLGLPFLARVFSEISTAFKTNTTYKDELRKTLRNYFTDFANGFNQLTAAAENAMPGAEKGRRILFVVDGTDRLGGVDARAFFETDVHQLQLVHGVFMYCAPVHLAYEGNVRQNFSDIVRLPMIKVTNRDNSRNDDGRNAMLKMLHRRAAPNLFDAGVADTLVEHSGGHPRDLLRLLLNAFKHAKNDRFDDASASHAIREMAADYRRILNPEDYQILAAIDNNNQLNSDSGRLHYLLYNLALLEYNDFYLRSHPVIRTTQEYLTAQQNLTANNE